MDMLETNEHKAERHGTLKKNGLFFLLSTKFVNRYASVPPTFRTIRCTGRCRYHLPLRGQGKYQNSLSAEKGPRQETDAYDSTNDRKLSIYIGIISLISSLQIATLYMGFSKGLSFQHAGVSQNVKV